MLRFSFRRGLRFFEGLAAWTISRRFETGKIQMEDEKGELRNMTEDEVMRKYVKGELVVDAETLPSKEPACHILVPRDLSTFPEKEQKEALRKQEYLKKLSEIGPICYTAEPLKKNILKIAAEIGDSNPPSVSTIFRWNTRFGVGKSATSLVNRNEKKGRRSSISGEVQQIVDVAIEEIYFNKQKYSKKDVCERIQRAIRSANATRCNADQLVEPSIATMYRYFDRLYQYEVDLARLGRTAATSQHRPSLGLVRVKRIHDRWEVDHTPLDLLVYCEKTGLPMGRPWITVIIDRYSRYILGFYISFQHPSANSVLQAVVHAILPKEEFLSQFPDIKAKWLAMGFGDIIVCDNGMDFHSESFIAACQEIGLSVWFCPAKTPQYKGSIERFFRTLNHGLIHKLPGSVFNNPDNRGDYESEKLAAISFQALNHLITKWIVEIYHQTPHRSLRTTPHNMWQKGMAERLIEHPVSPDQLRIIAGKTKTRSLFLYGIELDGLKYNSKQLQYIRRREGETIEIRLKYYEEDVGYIHVWDSVEKGYLRVDAVNSEYANGLHRAQHRLIRQHARDKEWDHTNVERLMDAKVEMAKIILDATKSRKMIDRKLAAQARGINSSNQTDSMVSACSPICKSSALLPEQEDFGLDEDISHLYVERDYFSRGNKHQEI
ncbi:MAG: transposase family protein [Nitrosomonadales bacterium]|nr:transposase family protein [Nitrosomonadales bacterium]